MKKLLKTLNRFGLVIPVLFGGSGSGGGGSTTTSTVNQRNIPPELVPYYQVLLNASTKTIFSTGNSPDPNPIPHVNTVDTSARDYVTNPYVPGEAAGKGFASGGTVQHFADTGAVVDTQSGSDPSVGLNGTVSTLTNAPTSPITSATMGTDITGMYNYVPYGENADGTVDFNKYVAGYTPMQVQASNAAANLSAPNLTDATNLSSLAGLNYTDNADQATAYGSTAADIGTAASNAAKLNSTLLGNTALGAGATAGAIGSSASNTAQTNAGILGDTALTAGANAGAYGSAGASIGVNGGNFYGDLGKQYGDLGAGYGATGAAYGNTASSLGVSSGLLGMQGAGTTANANALAGKAANAGTAYANQATDANTVQGYMNPYLQNSLQPQFDLLQQQNDITKQKNNSQASQAGAYGGSRQAVTNALTDQGNALATANLVGQSYNQAYNTAQSNLLAGNQLAMQGYNTANSALGTGLQGINTGLQGLQQGINAQNVGISGAQAGMQGAGLGIQGAQVGLSGVDRALAGTAHGIQGQQAALQGVSEATQAGQYGLAGAGVGIAGQQANLQGVNDATQAGQYGLSGAGVGIQGQQAGLAGVSGSMQANAGMNATAGTLSTLGTQQLANQQSILGTQNTLGTQRQALNQQKTDSAIALQDYLQNRSLGVLGQYGNFLNGVQVNSNTEYKPAPSMLSQIGGLAATGIGAAKAFGAKEGGVIPAFAEGGTVNEGHGIGDLAVYNALNGIPG